MEGHHGQLQVWQLYFLMTIDNYTGFGNGLAPTHYLNQQCQFHTTLGNFQMIKYKSRTNFTGSAQDISLQKWAWKYACKIISTSLWANELKVWNSNDIPTLLYVNSLGPSDVILRQRSLSTLTQVMACCLTAPSHYLNQCWLIVSEVQVTFISGQFHKRCLNHQSINSVWKLHI